MKEKRKEGRRMQKGRRVKEKRKEGGEGRKEGRREGEERMCVICVCIYNIPTHTHIYIIVINNNVVKKTCII